ncbi:MAG: DUF177 domain-containing protein [Nitrosomonas sp. PRO4]|nr:DUF177 domain-containing protein [Nitrosomonas sp. PRO4]
MSVRFVIDSLDFVRNAGIRRDKIPLLELTRLHDLLYDHAGEVTYQICGYFDDNNKPILCLEITGTINLCCQRCLDKLVQNIDLQTFLLLTENEAELDRNNEDDTMDAILAVPDLDVWSLIEEEIILSLSISSRHPDGMCKMHKLLSNENNSIDVSNLSHPFKALAAFKKIK